MTKEIINGLENEKNRMKKSKYLGLSVAVTTILVGIFFIAYDGYFIGLIPRALPTYYENIIGTVFVLAGTLKTYASMFNNMKLKRIMIIVLSVIWGGFFTVAMVYSFGAGYPNLMFVLVGKVTFDCLRVAFKGEYRR